MGCLRVITNNENEGWDKLVKGFKNYDIYYLYGYSRAFQIHGDGQPMLIFYEDGNIKAINVVMKRDIAKDEHFAGKLPEGYYFDLTTPYGYGGFLVEGESSPAKFKLLDYEYNSFCRNKGIVSEFVRFHPVVTDAETLDSVYEITSLGKTISMNLDSKEQIWNDLTSKNRNMVRKAQKEGVEIFWGRNPESSGQFIQIYNATMDKIQARPYYYFGEAFYHSILTDLRYNALIFYAVYQGKTIASSIIMFSNQKLNYHLSASAQEYRHLAPTTLLLYEAAVWGCENGYKIFHLGGGLGSKEDSLYKFKSSFNRSSHHIFKVGKKVFDEEKYQHLLEIRKAAVGTSDKTDIELYRDYFPQYRADFRTSLDLSPDQSKGIEI